ncbi:MAG: DUF883 family protein [Sterolibacterium sp.]|nr:DUF883 family protein [Sterolibacterium sp.]
MSQPVNAITDQLIGEFNTLVSQAEELMKYAANAGGDKAGALRTGVEQNLATAKKRLRELQQAATKKTLAAAHSTDEYVHENPWQTIGVVAGVSAVIGVVTCLLLNRR